VRRGLRDYVHVVYILKAAAAGLDHELGEHKVSIYLSIQLTLYVLKLMMPMSG
jgi:hypothetical protein